MDTSDRAALLGDDLTKAVDALTTCWPLSQAQAAALSDLLAAALGRVTSLAASAAVEKYHLIGRMDTAEQRLDALEAREAGGG